MPGTPKPNDTRLLEPVPQNVRPKLEALLNQCYPVLRKIAGDLFKRQSSQHTLQPTALVHEAYLLMMKSQSELENDSHFCAAMALTMRRVLIDHARGKNRKKRGQDFKKVQLDDIMAQSQMDLDDLLSIDTAIDMLAAEEPRKAFVVTLKFYGGLTNEEAGEVLGVSSETIKLDWRFARAWLKSELASGS